MLAKIQKWGNSQGLRITKALLADAQINVGDDVNIAAKNGALIITPARKNRKKYNLKDDALVKSLVEGSLHSRAGRYHRDYIFYLFRFSI